MTDDAEDDPVLAALQAQMPNTPLHAMDGYRFDHEGDAQVCTLPPGHQFIVVCGGLTNTLMGKVEPGEYVFKAPALPEGGMWPQLIMAVKDEHVQGVLNMPGEATRELVKLIVGEVGVN